MFNFLKNLQLTMVQRAWTDAILASADRATLDKLVGRERGNRGKGRGDSGSTVLALHRWIKAAGRPTDARRWHKPEDPHQQQRIDAAKAKRERRAAVLHENTRRSYAWNRAHQESNWQTIGRATFGGITGVVTVAPLSMRASSLNPFAVNRSGAV